jgi:arylsulfatase A-like enzyme
VAPAPARPNVLFIMADQLRYDCLGANGNRIVRTPHLDRLADQSANLANTFVQAPVCVPSRISFFTGRYPHSHRNRVNYTPCDPREVLMQRRLQQAGYRTGSVGKLHYYPPTAAQARSTGFDEVLLDDGHGRLDEYSDYAKWRKQHDPKAEIPYDAAVKNRKDGSGKWTAGITSASGRWEPFRTSPRGLTARRSRNSTRRRCSLPGGTRRTPWRRSGGPATLRWRSTAMAQPTSWARIDGRPEPSAAGAKYPSRRFDGQETLAWRAKWR